jgi:MoaA/NifB/PqqE/SkfB family radical SAM enzyme
MFHPRRVASWLDGENVYPLYLEVSPAGACNHRCTFCAKDYLGYRPNLIATDVMARFLAEAGSLGIASIMYGGEGEPLLHPDITTIIAETKGVGVDAAVSSNGVLLSPHISRNILPHLTWLKVSINAGTPEGYARIHRCDSGDFSRVIENLTAAAALIRENGWTCTLGTQAVLLPDNAMEMETLAGRLREAGVHYLVIKPYSQHQSSHTRTYEGVDYAGFDDLAERLSRYNTDRFSVIFRRHTMAKLQHEERGYGRCLALPFWAYVDAAGGVWGCSSYLGDERFLYGNINSSSFKDIWQGERRRCSLEYVASGLDAAGCRQNCRMDEVNRYLWELTHPSPHVNFI